MTKEKPEPTKITKEQREKLTSRRTQPWRTSIVEYLSKGPANDIEIYNATRPDRLDISASKKTHNIASQLTYLKDDGYIIIRDEDKLVAIADPDDNLYPGANKYL